MRNVPMFSVPPRAPVELSKLFVAEAATKGVYAKYRTKTRVACDECIAYLHEHSGVGPSPMAARHTRRGSTVLCLCGPHVELWRDIDRVGKT